MKSKVEYIIRGSHKTNLKRELERAHDLEFMTSFRSFYCFSCGEYLHYKIKGNELIPSVDECFDENQTLSFDIAVPTGKLIMCDWPKYGKEILGHLNEGDSINSQKGVADCVQRFASENIIHLFVSNTSPSVFLKDGIYTFGNDSFSYDGEDGLEEEVPLVEGSESVGWICTDLWWITIMDVSTYKALALQVYEEDRAREIVEETVEEADALVTVDAGIYTCNYPLNIDFDEDRSFGTMFKKN